MFEEVAHFAKNQSKLHIKEIFALLQVIVTWSQYLTQLEQFCSSRKFLRQHLVFIRTNLTENTKKQLNASLNIH